MIRSVRRLIYFFLVLLTAALAARAQSSDFVGDFSNMSVGTVRPIRVQVHNSLYGNTNDVFYVSAKYNGQLTTAVGFSFYLNNAPFENEFLVSVDLDSFGNGTSAVFYMKALAPLAPIEISACGSFYSGGCTAINLGSGSTTPSPTPSSNPAPDVSAVGVGEIVPYWLVTPAPVAEAYRNQTVHFTVQPNDWVGVAANMNSATWGAAMGVDMQIDSAGHGRTQTFYVKGRKRTGGPMAFSANSANHFAVASQTRYMTVAQITLLSWIPYDGDHPLDDNPNFGGGGRFYADKTYASETNESDWRLVGIKAQISPAMPGMNVRFKVFDVDDPSAYDGVDPNGVAGNDNREFTYGLTGNLTTNSSGAVTQYYTVSSRPGDNYRVAATLSSQPLATTHPLRQRFDAVTTDTTNGTKLKVSGYSGTLPEYSPSTSFPTQEAIVASPMLTVWRRLHIERDSLGVVANNNAAGSFYRIQRSQSASTSTFDLDSSTPRLDNDRFQNGRLVFKENASATPISYKVISNTDSSVTVEGNVYAHFSTDTFLLYDDDDFNMNDGTELDGDQGENIPAPHLGLFQDSDDPALNVLAPAYISPRYDLLGGEDADLPFVLNTAGDTANFDNLAYEADPAFWTIYILNAYQFTNKGDCDPKDPNSTYCGVADLIRPDKGVVFFEENWADGINQQIAAGQTVNALATKNRLMASMIGRMFNANLSDGGLMNSADICTTGCLEFTAASLNQIRTTLNP